MLFVALAVAVAMFAGLVLGVLWNLGALLRSIKSEAADKAAPAPPRAAGRARTLDDELSGRKATTI